MRNASSQARKVLVVDDDADSRKLMSIVIARRFKADVTAAESGRQAITHLSQESFDLVVSDLEMPNGSGLDVLAFVEAGDGVHPRFILYTAADVSSDLRNRALVFQKPGLQKALSCIAELGIFRER